MRKHIFIVLLSGCLSIFKTEAQVLKAHQHPKLLNPILPGYFADPTIKKIGDTYYIYATTDGTGWGAGPSQVWTSKDFLNWTIQPMNWPNTHWYWAPDMTQGYDGRYYLYYSQPVEIFGAVSDTPVGPWVSIAPEGKSVIPNYLIPGVITLDAQSFTDDDGRIYMFWGTWGIYPDHGCAVGLLNKDMKSFEKIDLIPNTVAKEFFEAPIMFKRNNVYYMMYSSGHCEDHTYRVQYVKSTTGPMGPFEYPDENPILVTNEDGSIHGPGHHSILEEDGRFFIVYHRHNNPHSGGGFHRQVAVDELFFTADGNIEKVKPTHKGIQDLIKGKGPEDLALGKPVKASSYYNEDFRPSFAVDQNNGTLWRAEENHQSAWMSVDLGQAQDVQTVSIQFEYPTYAYQYTVETSLDGHNWTLFVDRSENNRWGSPILEHGQVKARYVRLNILNTQLKGLPRGVWNMMVYGTRMKQETIWSDPQTMPEITRTFGNLLHLDAGGYQEGQRLSIIENKGILGDKIKSEQTVLVKNYQGRKAFFFNGATAFRSTFAVPQSLEGNSPYTVSMWVNNPTVGRFEDVLAWSKGGQDLTKAVFGVGNDPQRGAVVHGSWPDLGFKQAPSADQWHHVVISFDGYIERLFVDNVLQREENRMLFVRTADSFVIGASDAFDNNFSGYLADLQLYNKGLSSEEISALYMQQASQSSFFAIQTDDLDLGAVHVLKNHGSDTGETIRLADATVKIFGKRTALEMEKIADPKLQTILKSEAYTLDFDLFDGKQWNHYILIHNKDNNVLYINGQLTKVSKLKNIFAIKDNLVEVKSAIHFFNAYRGALSATEALGRYHIWQSMSKGVLDGYKPTISIAPRYVNDTDVFVQLADSKDGLSYLFSSGTSSSGWIDKSYYLFSEGQTDKAVQVIVKDEFGNVSETLSVVLPTHKPMVLPGVQSVDRFALPTVKIPFWDAFETSPNLDSTKTNIELSDAVWTIGSKHTKWEDAELLPPFVYKELSGDFTLQVKVDDVVGLSTQTRSSSESGIMIQDPAITGSYINNTILTGWNLGNLARSVGHRHQEGNTGSGLNFDPYIQVQKVGAYFFIRSSVDGKKWEDLPNTPFKREDLMNKKLKVGLYQIATNNQEGYGNFSDVKFFLNNSLFSK
ncbi:family 43 glycosylhydrolase [Sphingobacterium tabacisoli]|uniref:Family 43 glycosylhydrolase n=1 Tax=Sphingobacterium tabacisoli TaxID=2044855 RepID=A0ABW5L978_9SPHI|nr:family 43 glycosylhydrolase [Sphingobacterium tabacisoli]